MAIRRLQGDPSETDSMEAPRATPFRRVLIRNDCPNLVYVRLSSGASAKAYDYAVKPRRGSVLPVDSRTHISLIVDPAGQAAQATDAVLFIADDVEAPVGSDWAIGAAAGSTTVEQVLDVDAAGNPIGSTDYAGAARLVDVIDRLARQLGVVVGTGDSALLANDAAVGAGGNVATGALNLFRAATAFVSVSAATTVTVNLRAPSGAWYQQQTWAPTAAGTNALRIDQPGTGLQIVSSAAINWTVEYQTER